VTQNAKRKTAEHVISLLIYDLDVGKVRGASLRGGNLRGVVRGMRLLVSDFP